MSFYAYVIFSESYNRFYKGHCQNLEERLREHNAGKTKSIKAFRPWKLVYFEEFQTREEAILREKYFKTAAGRKYLKKKIFTEQPGVS
jgi:putative endonuclease